MYYIINNTSVLLLTITKTKMFNNEKIIAYFTITKMNSGKCEKTKTK